MKLISGFCIISILILGAYSFPKNLQADPIPGTLPFGGLVSYSLPCTCPSSIGRFYISFVFLYFGAPFALPAGALTYIPGVSQLKPWYQIGIPGTWHLGAYVPDVSGGAFSCQMLLPPPLTGCIPFPTLGIISLVGTSKFE